MTVDNVEIGGGTIPTPGFTNLDKVHGEGIWKRSIQEGIPVGDNSVDKVRASHVLEHISAGHDRIYTFNEIHRALKPTGEFEIILPLVGYTDTSGIGIMVEGWMPYADPTHISFWWAPESFLYFCEGPFKANADYGIKLWTLDHWRIEQGWEGHVLMRPIK